MAIVSVEKSELKNIIGDKSDGEIDEMLNLFGAGVESMTEGKIDVEITPNRPDLLSKRLLLKAIRHFYGKDKGIKIYECVKAKEDYLVRVDKSVLDVRPYTSCCIVKNLKLKDDNITEIIELQEKLHSIVGRNRKKMALGVYPLDKITLPITYEARQPKNIKFVPLGEKKEMSADEILRKTDIGKNYAHLLLEYEKYPVFVDSAGRILSMPPVINSNETGRVDEETKEVFLECSGHDMNLVKKVLNIMALTLAEMGGKIYQMTLENEKEKFKTPELEREKIKLKCENVKKLLGLDINENEIKKLLVKHDIDYDKGVAKVPPYRMDFMHEHDLIEDIAISYGYEKIEPYVRNMVSFGEEESSNVFREKIKELLVGLEYIELNTYHLIKKEENDKLNLNCLETENSRSEYKILRSSLLPSCLRVLSENKDRDYPQRVFEIGSVFSLEKGGAQIKENENLIVAFLPGNYTGIKQIANYLFSAFGIKCEFSGENVEGFIEGRVAKISVGGKKIGFIGETHPDTLKSFGIKMPLAVMEIDVDCFLNPQPK